MCDNYSDKSGFKSPVRWLLGRQFLAGLKWISAYAFMGDKLNHKNWMQGTLYEDFSNKKEEFWFDYIADTGDGMYATYNIAYLCMSDIWSESSQLKMQNTALDDLRDPDCSALSFYETNSDKNENKNKTECKFKLPRGQFLFVGGDTAYHISDFASIKERFLTPFNCAYDDLKINLEQKGLLRKDEKPDRRPIFAIPANHDYYDALVGFDSQFSKRFYKDKTNSNEDIAANFGLKGFEKVQKSSYVAIHLPFDWWFWGLDTQNGKIDSKQQAFFAATFLPEGYKNDFLENYDRNLGIDSIYSHLNPYTPKKMIVATPEPIFSTCRQSPTEQDEIIKTYKKLGLEMCTEASFQLTSDKCRLDLSGDVHHYERYGLQTNNGVAQNYASVVSGGGGAFLHPTHINVHKNQSTFPLQWLYPLPKDSHNSFIEKLLNPFRIVDGGLIWLFGGFIFLLFSYFISYIQTNSKDLHFELNWEGATHFFGRLIHGEKYEDISRFGANENAYKLKLYISEYLCKLSIIDYSVIIYSLLLVVVLYIFYKKNKINNYWFFFIVPIPGLILIAIAALPFFGLDALAQGNNSPFFSALLLLLCLVSSGILFYFSRMYADLMIELSKKESTNISLVAFIAASFEIPRIFLFDKWSWFREWTREDVILGLLNITAISFLVFGFYFYGSHSIHQTTLYLTTIAIVLTLFFGLIGIALFQGRNCWSRIVFAILGAFHALFQIGTPFALAALHSHQKLDEIFIFVVSVIALTFLSRYFLNKENKLDTQEQQRWLLIKLITFFIAIVAVSCSITYLIHELSPNFKITSESIEESLLIIKTILLENIVVAFFASGMLSCLWFGWYLALAVACNGHFNEAGGAARLDKYRHMIRFKLTEKTLTGYVIGIDEPKTGTIANENLPILRLVDVFTIQAFSKIN